jgi:hypothetical protein
VTRSRGRGPGYVAAAVLAGLVAPVALLAGCSGGGEGTMSADTAGVHDQGGRVVGSDGDGRGEAAPRTANRTTVETRAVVRTGRVAVTSKDLDRTRQEVDDLLFAFGGTLEREKTSHDDEGAIDDSTLVLRVPVAKFDAAMDALAKLGTMRSSQSSSEDVTTEVIDVEERVQTIRNSLDRLQRFLRRSQNIDDMVRFESEITERESQLRSLEAQQAHLADQTSMATITLHLSTPATYVEPPGPLDDAGFLAGLRGGWNALEDFVVVMLTVLGAVLPFAVTIALVGVPTWLLVRAVLRRRHRSELSGG